MDVVEKRRPLDGRIKVRNMAGDEVKWRLSTLPTGVRREDGDAIFDPDTTVKTLESLGFGSHDGKRWRSSSPSRTASSSSPADRLGQDDDALLDAARLATDEVNVCTIEDPIEMIQPAFNQTQVQPLIDLNFAEGPALADAPGPGHHHGRRDPRPADRRHGDPGLAHRPPRLLDAAHQRLGVGDHAPQRPRRRAVLIGSTLIGVLAQRLVRTLCPTCKVPDEEVTRETLHEVVKPWRLNGGRAPVQGGRLSRNAA
jgi:general secretion pathway protein E